MKILLESHIPVAVARELGRKCSGLVVQHLSEWNEGSFLSAPDPDLLKQAARAGFTLATYDLKTIPPLLRRMAENGIHHAGVIFIDDATIRSSNVGAIVRALAAVWRTRGNQPWTDRCIFLQRNP